ncbi:hypothetical protein E2562_030319 [Oryza meyeriana var. granulata]|uniref:PIG-P domain-containing protein n=1 Tax=Oryza meyeriana var. granulata TaxID=110450 RepID=A0A6G1EZV0_9ORYZ|nr:hypothetical protein E2562_030319 [Oryza meyeriana var. granulata]
MQSEAAARSPRQTVSRLRVTGRRPKADPSRGGGGPGPSEAYGFVGSIAAVAYLAWAYLPEPWLRSLGVTCYPARWVVRHSGIRRLHSSHCSCSLGLDASHGVRRRCGFRHWALAVPSVLMAAAQGMVLYMGSNFLLAPAPTSLATVSDEFAREPAASTSATGEEKPIEPISDIGIDQINRLMFGNA